MNIVTTERLHLRQLVIADAPFILELLNQPAFIRFIGDRGVRTVTDAERYISQGPLESYTRHGFGLYLVELKTDQTPLGMCGLIKRDTLPDVDIGYAFLSKFWAHGYAREAATAVLGYAEETLKLKRVVAIVTPDNERSIHLLEQIGLKFERTLPEPKEHANLSLYAVNF
jgi:RimJ/RimL family protein N-acetyltransferase